MSNRKNLGLGNSQFYRKGGGVENDGSDSQKSLVVNPKQHLKVAQMNRNFAAKTPKPTPSLDSGSLNFSTSMEDLDAAFVKKPKMIRDPMSHRVIEKRRRDRMNNCLADLSHLIPTNSLKQGQGRIEKTEIIEMAIKHIKNLTNSVNQPTGRDSDLTVLKSSLPDRYLGFKECQDEVMRYLVEIEGWDAMDKLCTSLMAHLEQAGEKFRIMNDDSLSRNAKEEQYRHADEEMGTCHNPMNAKLFEVRAMNNSYPNVEMPIYPAPVQQQSMMNEAVNVAQENTPMETQVVFQNLNTFESAQQITRDHLKRDKHLWTLLQNESNSPSIVDSGLSTDHGSSVSNATAREKLSGQRAANNSKSVSETGSANSSNYGTADSSSEKTGSTDSIVYKFKHIITKRFSQEEKKVNPSDTSSSSSSDDKRAEKAKRKFRQVRSRSHGSGHFRNADAMITETASSEETGGCTNNDDVKVSNYVPAFILHPVGTHYLPISIHPSNIGSNVFTQKSQNVYHPISIPVNFGGPLLYMDNSCINSDGCTSLGTTSSTNSPMGCSGENSSTCNSENSPSPMQDSFKAQS